EHFLDQACKVFDALWQTLGVKRINVPTMRVVLQKGFDEDKLEVASQYLTSLNFCAPRPELVKVMEGKLDALECVVVTAADLVWNDEPVHRRRRIQTSVVRQERQAPLDERMLRRTRLLGDRQRDAITALLQIKRKHPEIAPVAV